MANSFPYNNPNSNAQLSNPAMEIADNKYATLVESIKQIKYFTKLRPAQIATVLELYYDGQPNDTTVTFLSQTFTQKVMANLKKTGLSISSSDLKELFKTMIESDLLSVVSGSKSDTHYKFNFEKIDALKGEKDREDLNMGDLNILVELIKSNRFDRDLFYLFERIFLDTTAYEQNERSITSSVFIESIFFKLLNAGLDLSKDKITKYFNHLKKVGILEIITGHGRRAVYKFNLDKS
jgi:hypothetical protein